MADKQMHCYKCYEHSLYIIPPNYCKCSFCHRFVYDAFGKKIPIEYVEPDKVYYVEEAGGNFSEYKVKRKDEPMHCACCQTELSFFDTKYVVNQGKRYCMFCHDVCKAGGYNKCVQKVHRSGYYEHKAKTHMSLYSISSKPVEYCNKAFHDGNEVMLTTSGIRIFFNNQVPKDTIRINNQGVKYEIKGINIPLSFEESINEACLWNITPEAFKDAVTRLAQRIRR